MGLIFGFGSTEFRTCRAFHRNRNPVEWLHRCVLLDRDSSSWYCQPWMHRKDAMRCEPFRYLIVSSAFTTNLEISTGQLSTRIKLFHQHRDAAWRAITMIICQRSATNPAFTSMWKHALSQQKSRWSTWDIILFRIYMPLFFVISFKPGATCKSHPSLRLVLWFTNPFSRHEAHDFLHHPGSLCILCPWLPRQQGHL